MVFVNGAARIRHADTNELYEIPADMLDFQPFAGDERSMGPETAYSAVLHHRERMLGASKNPHRS